MVPKQILCVVRYNGSMGVYDISNNVDFIIYDYGTMEKLDEFVIGKYYLKDNNIETYIKEYIKQYERYSDILEWKIIDIGAYEIKDTNPYIQIFTHSHNIK